jgi:16S rRNA processing protein RimM
VTALARSRFDPCERTATGRSSPSRRSPIDASHARPLEEAEYWDHDLIGCTVVTTDGADVGIVDDVLHAGGNEVLVVRGDAGAEHLIPLIADIVRAVEPRVRITIEPMPGLLE